MSGPVARAQQTNQAAPDYGDQEKLLRLQADQYAEAFAKGDAKAIADMWAKDATFVDAGGRGFHGRQEIEKLYTRYFSNSGGQPLAVNVESIRFPSSTVAVEEGTTHMSQAASPGSANRYTAVHVKEDGRWQMYSVTETEYTPSSTSEYLEDLSWLIGDWTGGNPQEKVHLKARWVADKHFILCTYRPDSGETEKVSDTEVIGWNPVARQIFSSYFGSNGGFGRSVWSRDGQSWVRRAHIVQPDGKRGTALYVLHPLDKDTFTWRSTRRTLDGMRMPDTVDIKVSRDSTSK